MEKGFNQISCQMRLCPIKEELLNISRTSEDALVFFFFFFIQNSLIIFQLSQHCSVTKYGVKFNCGDTQLPHSDCNKASESYHPLTPQLPPPHLLLPGGSEWLERTFTIKHSSQTRIQTNALTPTGV